MSLLCHCLIAASNRGRPLLWVPELSLCLRYKLLTATTHKDWTTSNQLTPLGSNPDLVKWDFWWTKWCWSRFSPSTSVSPANLHSTKFSIIIIIRGRYNRPFSGRRAEWTQLGLHPPLCAFKEKKNFYMSLFVYYMHILRMLVKTCFCITLILLFQSRIFFYNSKFGCLTMGLQTYAHLIKFL
jgi:hypothetical protein